MKPGSSRTSAAAQRGLTLIELMVAMTIGLLLLAGTASLFISNKRIYREQEELSRLQENGRFALEMLIGDIRMTGFVGCHDILANVTNHVSTDQTELTSFLARVEGSENGGDWLPSGATDNKGDAGSDGVTIRYLDPLGLTLTAQSTAGTATPLTVSSAGDLRNGELIAVADCADSDVLAIDDDDLPDATETSIDNDAVITRVYNPGAQVMRFVARRYFVRDAGAGPFLWVVENGGAAQELIEGVEGMEVLYGLDDNDADTLPNSYVDADAADAAGWDNVVSVRVALLLRTVDDNVNNEVDTRVYSLLGVPLGPFGDQRRRRVFTATISIRNNT